MSLARFKKLCIDANDPLRMGTFWADVLAMRWEPDERGEGGVFGAEPGHTIWFNQVPEAKTVKNRIHLDVFASGLTRLQELGSEVVLPEGDGRSWTVMADPEGGEYCAFLRDDIPDLRVYRIVVDCADSKTQAAWWSEVFGVPAVDDERGFSKVGDVPGISPVGIDFIPVPEPKTTKNRIHWDLAVPEIGPLVGAGASVLRPMDDEIQWHIMADLEGNEFCAFVDEE